MQRILSLQQHEKPWSGSQWSIGLWPVRVAASEWLISLKTPEANIRADVLVIWPALLILTIWAAIRAALSYRF